MIFFIYFVLLTCSITGIFTLHKNSNARIRQQNNTFTPRGPEARNETWKNPNLPFWSNVSYAGETTPPTQAFKKVRSFPMFFLEIGPNNQILDKKTRTVLPDITLKHPKDIDFNSELQLLKNAVTTNTDADIQNMYNWDLYPNMELTPLLNKLIKAYNVNVIEDPRIQAFFYALTNDATVIAYFYKFLFEIPRPNQLDQTFQTFLCTRYFPTYPSGHAVVISAGIEFLSLHFPAARPQLERELSNMKKGRFYSGVHFSSDINNGEELGRKIGNYYWNLMIQQKDENGNNLDTFGTPNSLPSLAVYEKIDQEILVCRSLINQRSLDYNQRIRQNYYNYE